MKPNASRSTGVLWISGYSGSGKTTVGRKVEIRLRRQGIQTIFLDGDDLRAIFSNRWGFSREERIELAKIYFRLCSHLSSQGYTVIIAAVAMYDEVRMWLRENVSNSIEVFLSVPDEVLRERDKRTKKVYAANQTNATLYDAPTSPDIAIENHSAATPDDTADSIVAFYLSAATSGPSDRGRQSYWNGYYGKKGAAPEIESSFARYISGCLDPASRVLEVGCGNGRDSFFFSAQGHAVTAIDKSTAAIDLCRSVHPDGSVNFIAGTLADATAELAADFDMVYSRFCLHAMTPDEESAFIDEARKVLRTSGFLAIECRSINDPLARKGEILSPTERLHGHYRRFIVLDDLVELVTSMGYLISHAAEYSGVADLGDDTPVVIRLIARRPQASAEIAP